MSLKYDIWTHIKNNKTIYLYEKTPPPANKYPGYTFISGDANDITTKEDVKNYTEYLAGVDYTDAATLKISTRLITSYFTNIA
jgi:hypothetical protein